MLPNKFATFLMQHLQKNIGMNKELAARETAALIEGKRRVQNGEYALLVDENEELIYYKRIDNKWALDKNIAKNIDSSDMFCNLQKKCLVMKGTCNDEHKN